MSYAKLNDALGDLPALTENENTESLEKIGAILYRFFVRASRLFDSDTNAPIRYYEAVQNPSQIETRTFYSRTRYFHLPYFRDLDSAVYNGQILDIEDFQCSENDGNIFINTRTCLWQKTYRNQSHRLAVSAKFGYKCVPEDVKEAVSAKGLLLFRQSPNTNLDIKTDLNELIDIPILEDVYNTIVKRYQFRNRFLPL